MNTIKTNENHTAGACVNLVNVADACFNDLLYDGTIGRQHAYEYRIARAQAQKADGEYAAMLEACEYALKEIQPESQTQADKCWKVYDKLKTATEMRQPKMLK